MQKSSTQNLRVKFIDWGIACRIGDNIYVNKKLQENMLLCKRIIQHELEHSSGFTMKDITMDLKNSHLKGLKKEYYSFILSNPKSWIEFLPMWKYDGRFVFNPLIMMAWGLTLLMIALIISFM